MRACLSISIIIVVIVCIQVHDLCVADSCKLLSAEKMMLYYYSKR